MVTLESEIALASETIIVAEEPIGKESVFEQAARIYDGWNDPDTGLRVLKIHTRADDTEGSPWSTVYHQSRCFLDNGRKVMLYAKSRRYDGSDFYAGVLNLTTGELECPFPKGYDVAEVRDSTNLAALSNSTPGGERAVIWDLRAEKELASMSLKGWTGPSLCMLSDDRRAIAMYFRRKAGGSVNFGPRQKTRYYALPIVSRHYLLSPDEPARLLFEADGFFCNHMQCCPTNPELYSYNRWPTPERDIEQVITLHSLDGTIDKPLPLEDKAIRPCGMYGVRDHYLWTPDGTRIVSYLNPNPFECSCDDPRFNHLILGWVLSVLDVKTGEDLSAPYPKGRWGGHMQISPDSRHIVCVGGPDFLKLFLVDIEGLRYGWNERILCSCPKSVSIGHNGEPFPYPFVLPDKSGVIFNAGWPGPEHGVYMVEWPKDI